MNKNKNYNNEVEDIYEKIMRYTLTELLREANRLGVRTNSTNVGEMGMIIDDMIRVICKNKNIPTQKNDDIYFGVSEELKLWLD
tara:strand:- start:472 stop:723 length:252 start_codon:yes stop_codon:yes gene_type:complete